MLIDFHFTEVLKLIMSSKVCILTAGVGRRLGQYAKTLNKALLPLEGMAVISHIVEKFPADTEYVIAVGYKAAQVTDYLQMAHADRRFTFVHVDNFDREGSGPGHSLLCCRQQLASEFFLICSDTLWTEDMKTISTERSWAGVAEVPEEVRISYCNIMIENDRAVRIFDKTDTKNFSTKAFIGLAFIKESERFFDGLEKNEIINGEKQISSGFNQLIEKGLLWTETFNWVDVGTAEKYVDRVKKDNRFDFSKSSESIFFVGDRVIKFYEDKKITSQRVEKSRLKPLVFPTVDRYKDCFYSYKYQRGVTLYRQNSPERFAELLKWLHQNLWTKPDVPAREMANLCDWFYRGKTLNRLEMFSLKYPDQKKISLINGKVIPSAAELFMQVDWHSLSNGVASFIHGDLQPDNIIFDKTENKFLLLDWRQEFGGRIDIGDIYYDFAKLWGGLILNYDLIKANKFTYSESADACEFDFPSHPFLSQTEKLLQNYVEQNGYSVKKIKLLVGIIYLNMSPLHQYPFDKMLHALGRQMLFDAR